MINRYKWELFVFDIIFDMKKKNLKKFTYSYIIYLEDTKIDTQRGLKHFYISHDKKETYIYNIYINNKKIRLYYISVFSVYICVDYIKL